MASPLYFNTALIIYLIPTRIITTGISALIHAQVLFKNAVMINSLYFTQLTITSRPPAAIHPNKNLLITVHTVTVPKSMTLYSRITEKEGDLLLKEMIRNTLTYLQGNGKTLKQVIFYKLKHSIDCFLTIDAVFLFLIIHPIPSH